MRATTSNDLLGLDSGSIRARIADLLPVQQLVPEVYREWRPLVQDAVLFFISYMSEERLASKMMQQLQLPPETGLESRLMVLIEMMPGLQKLGQVLARNRHLDPSLRTALSTLENGISEVRAEEIRAIIFEGLGARLKQYCVEVDTSILSEATVSAVVRFTWANPDTGGRERGVFKVLKPHVPPCFAEDMRLMQGLAQYLVSKNRQYGFAGHSVPNTVTEIRRLLERELDFPREQATLVEACQVYHNVPGVRVPRVIAPLCTATITAITEEDGVKVTDAFLHTPERRSRIAGQLVDALVAVPLLEPREGALFHADPHAGNLLYDEKTRDLVILDWALTERLSREQRRHLIMLMIMLGLRDAAGVRGAVDALAGPVPRQDAQNPLVRDCIIEFLAELPRLYLPGSMDALRLLDRLARAGVTFPTSLLMFRKALFTIDGIVHEIAPSDSCMDTVLARRLVTNWPTLSGFLLSPIDWFTLQFSALLYWNRLWAGAALPAGLASAFA